MRIATYNSHSLRWCLFAVAFCLITPRKLSISGCLWTKGKIRRRRSALSG